MMSYLDGTDICPGCSLATFNGRCITLGCIHYRFPAYWEIVQADEPALEEDNHFA